MPLSNLYARIVKLQEFDIQAETIRIINENSDILANMLTRQLKKGVDADGEPALAKYGPFYASPTVLQKEREGEGLGAETDRVTNYMSGMFYLSLRVQASDNNFVFLSDAPYFQDILIRSKTHRIVELNQKFLNQFSKYILKPQLKIAFDGV